MVIWVGAGVGVVWAGLACTGLLHEMIKTGSARRKRSKMMYRIILSWLVRLAGKDDAL
jgi:hypothetical protein